MTKIVLPWPPAELSPNARVHWTLKSRKAKQYKHDCWALTLAAKVKVETEGKINLHITFRPPSNRRRDQDNMVAQAKYAFDGMALALGVDDSRFSSQFEIGELIRGGAIEVTFLEEALHG
jgi:crossover junction endodeoxyribonuclease RusA